jgi:hypothetical protein
VMEWLAWGVAILWITLCLLAVFDIYPLAFFIDGKDGVRPLKPKKQTTTEVLAEISARRAASIDAAHLAWEEWWKAVTDAPVPLRAAKKAAMVKEPLPYGQRYTRREVQAAIFRSLDADTSRKLRLIEASMTPDAFFTPSANDIDVRNALETVRLSRWAIEQGYSRPRLGIQ